MSAAKYGWYGDDFTGATDTLAVLAQAGLRSMLFMGIPSQESLAKAGPLDAIGIAGAARSMTPDAMKSELSKVSNFFREIAPPVLHYKVCSTFDSSVNVGNIACAIECLHPAVENRWLPIIGGQPSLGRYCTFSNLFAAAGVGGTVHRIDRHPTMSRHPVTPMAEADLRLHLGHLGLNDISFIHFPDYDGSPEELDKKLCALQTEHSSQAPFFATLLDLNTQSQLATVGRLLWNNAQKSRLLAVGASSVAQALIAHWSHGVCANVASAAPLKRASDPVFAWAGSLSALTAAQVDAATSYQRIAVDAQLLCHDADYQRILLNHICSELQAGQHVLAYTAPIQVQTAQLSNASQVASASANLIARVVQERARSGTPLHRIGIAGGDTSSHAVQALKLWALSYQSTLCQGVTLSRAHSDQPSLNGMELMLKGGQMGGIRLFQELLGQ